MTARPDPHPKAVSAVATTGVADLANRILYPARARPTARPSGAGSTPGGLYLGWGTAGPVLAGADQHVMILGPPRSGKTTRLLVPSVMRHRGPAVVTSTKPDVLAATIAARRTLGQCWYWDPSGTTITPAGTSALAWSPVTDCDTWDQAVTRAHSLAGAARPAPGAADTHWIERAEALLAPLLHAAAVAGADLAVVLSWLHRRELAAPIAVLDAHRARRGVDILEGIAHTDSRELSGIYSTADSLLAAYRTDAALRAARRPNFDPADFAASTDTVYIIAPAVTQAMLAPLIVALLEQIRTSTYRWHPQPPMLYALDEVANIAPLPDLPATLAEGGSQGLVVLACLQDLSQARTRWGPAADGFLTLFAHKLLLPGIADPATLKAVSTLAGHTDVPVRSRNTTDTLIPRTTTTWSQRRQPLLPENRIATSPPGTAILISAAHIQRVAT